MIEVIGAHRTVVILWEETLPKLGTEDSVGDRRRILGYLYLSYDALEEQHKEMYLDVACALERTSMEKPNTCESIKVVCGIWYTQSHGKISH